jgi:hypothetical protein
MVNNDPDPVWTDDTADDPLAGLAEAAQSAAPAYTWQGRGPALDMAGRIDADITCRGCGYNLRGQSLSNTCPECGASVEWSTRVDRLAYHDPAWLGSLKRGMLWFIIAIFAAIALSFVNFVVASVLQPAGASPFAPQPGQAGSPPNFTQAMRSQMGGTAQLAVGLVIGMISSALYLIGIWQLTTPMPGASEGPVCSSRVLFRWGWITATAISLAGQAALMVHLWVGMALSVLTLVPMLFAFFAMFVYLGGLARRVPNRSLASQTRTVMWGFVLSIGLFPAAFLLAMLVALLGGNSSGIAAAVAIITCGGACLGLLGVVGLSLWWLVLLFFYYADFAKAEQHARGARRHGTVAYT